MGIVFLQGVLISLCRVLKLDFQFFSGVFPWGFENVLDYQEELAFLNPVFRGRLEMGVCSGVFSALGVKSQVCFVLFLILRRVDRSVCGFSSGGGMITGGSFWGLRFSWWEVLLFCFFGSVSVGFCQSVWIRSGELVSI